MTLQHFAPPSTEPGACRHTEGAATHGEAPRPQQRRSVPLALPRDDAAADALTRLLPAGLALLALASSLALAAGGDAVIVACGTSLLLASGAARWLQRGPRPPAHGPSSGVFSRGAGTRRLRRSTHGGLDRDALQGSA